MFISHRLHNKKPTFGDREPISGEFFKILALQSLSQSNMSKLKCHHICIISCPR